MRFYKHKPPHSSTLAALFLAVAITSPVRASVVITFGSLADGETLTSYTSQGYVLSDPAGFTAIGPTNPYYLGATGIEPAGTLTIMRTDGEGWDAAATSFTLGLLGTGSELNIIFIGYIAYPNFINIDRFNAPFSPGQLISVIPLSDNPVTPITATLEAVAAPYQVTEIEIISPQAIPEPSSGTLIIIALSLLGIPIALERRRPRADASQTSRASASSW